MPRAAIGDLIAVPLGNGQHRLVWLVNDDGVGLTLLVMAGAWPRPPTKADVMATEPALARGPRVPGHGTLWKGWLQRPLPADVAVVARRTPGAAILAEAAEGSGTMVFGDGEVLRKELLTDWRLEHDVEALRAEWAAEAAARAAKDAARQAQRTLPKMLRERAFADWTDRSPAFVRDVRAIFRAATAELIALQAGGTKAQRRRVLRGIVSKLNALEDSSAHDAHDDHIDSVERDDIVARIDQLAALVGLSNQDEQLTGHRTW